ncbi:ROK family protein [Streptomyces sp. SBT349]|uniref:ROK family protein n=1 Tax=Streptomyces sp. SBT349 TaxID=1580539 RepID=UPI000AA9137B|nr:ROK family protein [Streptomyces sp. SBT349]
MHRVGLSPSTVSARVEYLLAHGYLRESGSGTSQGGRRPKLLEIHAEGGMMLAADFGAQHVRLAAVDVAGRVHTVAEFPWELAEGPARTVDWLAERCQELLASSAMAPIPARGLGVGLPGPVEHRGGQVVLPSRMPGWHHASIGEALGERLGLPVVVENDANLMAVGEHLTARTDFDHLLLVKVGSGIGSGVVSDGRLHHGARGAAGDISHVRVPAAGDNPCSCGNTGCLETIASGAAIIRTLAAQGVEVSRPADVVRLVEEGDALATTLVRDAGRSLGEVLATVVNFFNPEMLVLGGALSAVQPLLAAVRGAVYERCLPLATQSLTIDTAATGANAGVIGGGLMVLQRSLSTAGGEAA